MPPTVLSKEERRTSAMAELGVRLDERFSVFATRWWKSERLRIADRAISDYEWRLSYLQRFFGRYELNEIDVALVDRFRDELHEQAATIRAAADRGRPLIETVADRRVGSYQRHRRPLSNTSINAMLKLLGQIPQQAVDYDLIARTPSASVSVASVSCRASSHCGPSWRSTSSRPCSMPRASSTRSRLMTHGAGFTP